MPFPSPRSIEALEARRYAWAWRGLDAFVELLPESLRHLYRAEEAGRALVVTYGASQVGKTELVLRLLGYSPEQAKPIAEVLRAGRTSGRSSSSTPMRFRVGSTSGYALDAFSEESDSPLDGPAMSDRLQTLRKEVEAGRFPPHQLVTVTLPFIENPERPPIDVIDLPGKDSASKKEASHVDRALEYFLPRASVFILVMRADNMSELEFLPVGLRSWQHSSVRFRVVLTRAFSPYNVQQMLRDGGDRQRLEQYYADQLRHTLRQSAPERMYLLDYGQSWQMLDDALREKVGPWVDADLGALSNSIAAVGPRDRLRALAEMHHDVRLWGEEEDTKFAEAIAKASEVTDEQLQRLVSLERQGERLRDEWSGVQKRIDVVEQLQPIWGYSTDGLKRFPSDRKAVRRLLDEAETLLLRQYRLSWQGMNPPDEELPLPVLRNNAEVIIKGAFARAREAVKPWMKFIDEYSDDDSNQRRDMKLVAEALSKANQRLQDDLVEQLSPWKRERLARLWSRNTELADRVLAIEIYQRKQQKHIERCQLVEVDLDRRYQKFRAESALALARARNFNQALSEAFCEAWNAGRETLYATNLEPQDRCWTLLDMCLMQHDAQLLLKKG